MFSSCREWFAMQRKKSKVCNWNRCVRAAIASTEFVSSDQFHGLSDMRRQSLPRMLQFRFLSEGNVNDENDQLKQMLKETGLYHKHQTLRQRLRLKELLDCERVVLGTSSLVRNRIRDFNHGDDSRLPHSFRCTPNSGAGAATLLVDIILTNMMYRLSADMALPHGHSSDERQLRRSVSLSALPVKRYYGRYEAASELHLDELSIQTRTSSVFMETAV